MSKKYVYTFAGGQAEGNTTMKDLLGGKGANLAEMTNAGLPVPPGFTITTEACNAYYASGEQFPDGMWDQALAALAATEEVTGKKFGGVENPLLVSVRSGAKFSMPGMMDTVLNLGLNDETLTALAAMSGNERFAWDAYRRFIQLFGKIVLNIESEKFEHIFEGYKKELGVHEDTAVDAGTLGKVVADYKKLVKKEIGRDFPTDPQEQLKYAIQAVFASWNGRRAKDYRRINKIDDNLGTAVNVQTMVFGNLGEDSGTGVAFTRDVSTGEAVLYGEYLQNAQGEDVVAGIRTPKKIAQLHVEMPEMYNQFAELASRLEKHYKDVQDLEFTIEKGKLYMLQTRNAKRTGAAAVRIAVEMVEEGVIDKATAVQRVEPSQLDQLLHPMIDPKADLTVITTGLPASPGAASGTAVFDPDEAEAMAKDGAKVILVRTETSPEDFHGMVAAQAILTARGGMTCVAGETRILTDQGLLTAEALFEAIESGAQLSILSFDSQSLQTVWRKIIAAGRKPSEVITVAVSQTGRADQNHLRLTADHKMFTIQNRKLAKKRLDAVLADQDFLAIVDSIPALGETTTSPDMAYLAGAIFSDGNVRVSQTKGAVTFVQKPTPEKAEFIAAVEDAFEHSFGMPFTYLRQRETTGLLKGRVIHGSVEDRISFRRGPAAFLGEIRSNPVPWVLTLDRVGLLKFLAGYADGDGTYAEESSKVRLQITVARSNQQLLEGLIIAGLRLGIVAQVTSNRDSYLVQIAEHAKEILKHTHRLKAEIPARLYESKCFAVKALFDDIVEDVNFMGRVREGIKRNIMFGAEKLRRDILPLCTGDARDEVQSLLDSSLRSHRVRQVDGPRRERVYNFEVEAENELDKNFVVFSSRLTPVLVSNSHAAVVARGMGKCCVAGAGEVTVDYANQQFSANGTTVRKGDWITLDGSTGRVILGQAPVIKPEISGHFKKLMEWVNEFRKLGVRANADTPHDSEVARGFGAEGIGLCRTEHMFFEGERIDSVRQMILSSADFKSLEAQLASARADAEKSKSKDAVKRVKDLEKKIAKPEALYKGALAELLELQREDFAGIFRAMNGFPVTIRTLDPPLHEFVPHDDKTLKDLATKIKMPFKEAKAKVAALHEFNPMLGHRGCRLGIVYPEITEMQARAIFEAAVKVKGEGVVVKAEIMIPLVGNVNELKLQADVVRRVAGEVFAREGATVDYLVGTMIELPRAALTANRIAEEAEFFSFGTNDLTQTAMGLSRDDSGKFLPFYVDKKIMSDDPFQVLDQEGVGQLVEIGIAKGRSVRSDLKVGICGEHGGDPESVIFCHKVGMNYVSCSPYRVPIALLAAAHAALAEKAGGAVKSTTA
ncbi:MAG: pyruvate, phosphate dikinase [Blastocatellia bacterium]|nr:pyruvate, phosphate dikinase [Blastocatellia bacterium]